MFGFKFAKDQDRGLPIELESAESGLVVASANGWQMSGSDCVHQHLQWNPAQALAFQDFCESSRPGCVSRVLCKLLREVVENLIGLGGAEKIDLRPINLRAENSGDDPGLQKLTLPFLVEAEALADFRETQGLLSIRRNFFDIFTFDEDRRAMPASGPSAAKDAAFDEIMNFWLGETKNPACLVDGDTAEALMGARNSAAGPAVLNIVRERRLDC